MQAVTVVTAKAVVGTRATVVATMPVQATAVDTVADMEAQRAMVEVTMAMVAVAMVGRPVATDSLVHTAADSSSMVVC